MKPSPKLAVDGTAGSKTINVLKKWQKQYKLQKVDGVFGSASRKKAQEIIKAHAPKPTPTPTPKPTSWVDNAVAYAKKIANGKYHYVVWKPKVTATHTCPICKGRKYDNYFGWNCIGFSFSCWRHGGNIPCKCNCSVIDNATGEKIYNAKTDAKALKIAQDHIGIKDIKVIRNNKKVIPQSQMKAGDICLYFSGNTFKHMFFYIGNGRMIDCQNLSGNANDIKERKALSAKVVIRYTGK